MPNAQDSLYPTTVATSDAAVSSGKTNVVRFSERVRDWLNSLTPPTASVYDTGWVSITTDAVVTAGTIQYRRIGNEVHVRGKGTVTATLATGNTTLATGTLPAEVCPTDTTRGPAWLTGGFEGTAAVTSGGNVLISQQSGASRTSCQFYVVYFLG